MNTTALAHKSARCCIGACAAGVLFLPSLAPAAPLPNPNQMINYSVVDQDLHDTLTGIGEQLGLRTSISAQVHGRVHGRLRSANAETTLDRLAALYGFDWYCDGQTIFISAYNEAVSKVLPLGPVSASALAQTLSRLGITDDRWTLRAADLAGVIEVDGPPRYAALVDETLAALAQSAKSDVAEVHVFRGTAASP